MAGQSVYASILTVTCDELAYQNANYKRAIVSSPSSFDII